MNWDFTSAVETLVAAQRIVAMDPATMDKGFLGQARDTLMVVNGFRHLADPSAMLEMLNEEERAVYGRITARIAAQACTCR